MAWLNENIRGIRTIDDYVSAALTTGTIKREWVVNKPMKLTGVRINSGGAGGGAGSSTIDIMKNGVTVYATNAKPTIATASTGDWTVLPPDNPGVSFVAGDTIRYDVTAIPGTSGHTRTSIAITLKHI